MGMVTDLRHRLSQLRRAVGDERTESASAPISGAPTRPTVLPDPAKPPSRRGSWEEAALTNVEVTEVVKRQIRSVTRPWNK